MVVLSLTFVALSYLIIEISHVYVCFPDLTVGP